MKFVERLQGAPESDGVWRFDLAEELNGGFGGTNGGVLAAISLHAARGAGESGRANIRSTASASSGSRRPSPLSLAPPETKP